MTKDSGQDSQSPFAGYDDLNARQVMKSLSSHSQVELEAAETYERSHKDRKPVLDKLRYMRGAQPLPDYDSLKVDVILAALQAADLETIKRIRAYERKFANRPDILEEVVRVHHRYQEAHPADAPPGYEPMSASARS